MMLMTVTAIANTTAYLCATTEGKYMAIISKMMFAEIPKIPIKEFH